jgi:hypothetical protein
VLLVGLLLGCALYMVRGCNITDNLLCSPTRLLLFGSIYDGNSLCYIRRPCWISPYHLRIDWLMWFAAFQNYQVQIVVVAFSSLRSRALRTYEFVHKIVLCTAMPMVGTPGG